MFTNQQASEQQRETIDSVYAAGRYFEDPKRHSEDARFKANNFLRLFQRVAKENRIAINSYIDVGCGSGDIVKTISASLRSSGFDLEVVKGYDVSPHIRNITHEGIEFVHGDFSKSNESVDLVSLFDVFEHIPDPISFIKEVSQRCNIIYFHIPLDFNVNNAIRDKFRSKLRSPGHLMFMDSVYALNLLTLSGLRVIDYEYTFGFLAPSGHRSILGRLALPIRLVIAKISPWLLSKTIGGISLSAIAITPQGLNKISLGSGF